MTKPAKRKTRSYPFVLNDPAENMLLKKLRPLLGKYVKNYKSLIGSRELHAFAYQFASTSDVLKQWAYPAEVITWLIKVGKLELDTCYPDGSSLYRITNASI